MTEALRARGAKVVTPQVPPVASIQQRAEALMEGIEKEAKGRIVNIIACVSSCAGLFAHLADLV